MNKKIKVIVLVVLSFCSIAAGVCIGSVFVPPADVFKVLSNNVLGGLLGPGRLFDIEGITNSIVWNLRLPRTLLAYGVGAALSVSGTVMQSVLKNPLASSHTVGVSSGAAFGACLAIVTGFSIPFAPFLSVPFMGLVFGVLTVLAVVTFSGKIDKNMSSLTIVLAGMVFSLFMNAVMTILMSFSKDSLQRVVFWQMGSFSLKDWSHAAIMTPVALVLILIIWNFSKELDIMSFGEEQALAMGVSLKKVKWGLLILTALLTGAAISFAGVIGFIDLIAPHITRKFFGAGHKYVVPMSALFGGTFMVVCDIAARSAAGGWELPVGAVTALIGAPFFAYVYQRQRRPAPKAGIFKFRKKGAGS